MPARPGPRPERPVSRALAEVAARLRLPVPAADRQASTAGTPVEVRGITHDSRAVRPGDLYAALPGRRTHGARFTAEAVRLGATAVLTDRTGAAQAADGGVPVLVVDDPRAVLGGLAAWIYGEPGAAMLLVGITGTNGKTTTGHLVDAVLRHAGHRTGLVGTVETRIGEDVVPSTRTTPEAPDLQALLAVMRERDVTACTMEVSSHALVLGRVDGLVFDVAAFTNLSADHLDFHRDMADYYAAKAALFEPARARRGVVCVDDAWGTRLAGEAGVPVVTVATRPEVGADWRVAEGATPAAGGRTSFTLAGPDGTVVAAQSPLPGSFNVANAALATVVGITAGLPADVVVAGLAGAPAIPGRMEPVTGTSGDEPLAVVDYAHTPDAVDTAVAAVRAGVEGRLVVVLGAGGDRDPHKRGPMGAAAARHADLVVVTDDNPRTEDAAQIRAAVLAGAHRVAATRGVEVVEIGDRARAIGEAVRGLHSGDALLVLGKGHETGQEVGGVLHPFDDRRALRRALAAEAERREPV